MQIDLEDFLEQYVAGYGLEDLKSMSAVPARQIGHTLTGGVGYPMLQTAFAYVELLGYLSCPSALDPKSPADSRQAFKYCWEEYIYPTKPRRDVAEQVYVSIRNGLAHVAMPKGGVIVTKNAPHLHLTWNPAEQKLTVDASEFAVDLCAAYDQRFKPKLATLRSQMQQQLDRLINEYQSKFLAGVPTFSALPLSNSQGMQIGGPQLQQQLHISSGLSVGQPNPPSIPAPINIAVSGGGFTSGKP